MTDSFTNWAMMRGGFFRRSEAKDYGYTDAQIQSACRDGRWVRMRHGYYSFAAHVAALDDREKHCLLARTVLHRLGPEYVLVGTSACAAHGIELFDADLSIVHVARRGRHTGRREAGISYHECLFDPDNDVVHVNGLAATKADHAVWVAACSLSTEGALVSINSGLHQSIVSNASLAAMEPTFSRWSGSRTARLAFRLSDRRVETVGESRTFFLCWEFNLPRPQPQYEVRDARGLLVARTDFAWLEYRHVCEFDGKVKYLRYVRPGETPSDVVIRKKRREDLVRAERFGASRVVWFDLQGRQRPKTAGGLMSSLERSSSLYTRNRTTIVL